MKGVRERCRMDLLVRLRAGFDDGGAGRARRALRARLPRAGADIARADVARQLPFSPLTHCHQTRAPAAPFAASRGSPETSASVAFAGPASGLQLACLRRPAAPPAAGCRLPASTHQGVRRARDTIHASFHARRHLKLFHLRSGPRPSGGRTRQPVASAGTGAQ